MEQHNDKLAEILDKANKLGVKAEDTDLFVQAQGETTVRVQELQRQLDTADNPEAIKQIIEKAPIGTRIWRSAYRKLIDSTTDYDSMTTIFHRDLPIETREYLLYTLLNRFNLSAADFIIENDEKGGVTSQHVFRLMAESIE